MVETKKVKVVVVVVDIFKDKEKGGFTGISEFGSWNYEECERGDLVDQSMRCGMEREREYAVS